MKRKFSVKYILVSISLISMAIVVSSVISNRYFIDKSLVKTEALSQDVEIATEKKSVQSSVETKVDSDKKVSNFQAFNKIEQSLISDSKGLSKDVLHLALKAYYNASSEEGIENHKLTIIDYSLPSNQKRMWMIDMDKKTVALNTYVSHGVKSGDKLAKNFSNKLESHKTSIGVMKTGSIYTGKRGMSLHLHGLEDEFNTNVYNRHVVIHGSNYVNDAIAKARGKIGKSLGCPAVDFKVAKPLIKSIANGSLVFAYYPLKSWLKSSEYLM